MNRAAREPAKIKEVSYKAAIDLVRQANGSLWSKEEEEIQRTLFLHYMDEHDWLKARSCFQKMKEIWSRFPPGTFELEMALSKSDNISIGLPSISQLKSDREIYEALLLSIEICSYIIDSGHLRSISSVLYDLEKQLNKLPRDSSYYLEIAPPLLNQLINFDNREGDLSRARKHKDELDRIEKLKNSPR